MPTAKRLLRLYPRAWRERYGEEFLATAGSAPLRLQQVIDIVSGAIDARLSADVRRATKPYRVVPNGGAPMILRSMLACESRSARYSARDSLIGAGVMLGASLLFALLGLAAKRSGWPETAEALLSFGFLASFSLSMPFWLMKGQPWKAQVVVVGGTLAILAAIAWLTAGR